MSDQVERWIDGWDHFVDRLFGAGEAVEDQPSAPSTPPPERTGWEDDGWLGRVGWDGDDGSGLVKTTTSAAQTDHEPLTAWGVIKGLLLLAAGVLLIMALSEMGII